MAGAAAPKVFRIEVQRDWCKGCGICVALCPKEVLKLDEFGKVTVAEPAACVGCGRCEDHCPDFVLSVEEEGK